MTFQNSILAGNTLIREAIQSENFVSGSTGWQIQADGSAEFNDVVIRGGTTVGGDFLAYSGVPGPGTLAFSISSSGGTDQYGNVYPAGFAAFVSGDVVAQIDVGADPGFYTYGTRGGIDYITSLINTFLTLGVDGQANPGYVGYSDLGGGQVAMDLDSGNTGGSRSSALISLVSETTSVSEDHRVELTAAEINVNGFLNVLATDFQIYTPAVGGAGAATYTTRTGWYYEQGDEVFFTAYIVVNGAGSGASNVTIDAPVSIDRTTRQTVFVSGEGLTAGNSGSLSLVSFTGGSGATFDRLRNSTGANITGAGLAAGAILTATGRIRKA